MDFTALNWNIGGAKVLEQETKSERNDIRDEINSDLERLISEHRPDIVTLQEVAAYKQPSANNVTNIVDTKQIDALGYKCFFFPLIDSLGFSSQAKWEKISDTEKSDWEKNTYFAQGNGFLFRKDAPLFPFWDLSKPNQNSPGKRLLTILEQQETNPVADLTREFDHDFQNNLIECVHLEGGVYFGDRDTEPRAALVSHLILNSPVSGDPKPIDVFVINIHLVTIMKERVGIPSYDIKASQLRIKQVDDIFDGIISRYNSWFDDEFPHRGIKRKPEDWGSWETPERHQPVWLLCGDFNFTENSDEYDYIMRRNFIDTTPAERRKVITHDQEGRSIEHNGTKAKGAGNPATLTLDYIFAGPRFVALDPLFKDAGMLDNTVDYRVTSSDHYPVISKIPLFMVR